MLDIYQKDQSYDLSISSEESSNLEFHVGKETLILYLNVHFQETVSPQPVILISH